MRRDKLGRRIGRNWWREFIMDTYYAARANWERGLEATAIGYPREEREYREKYPPPRLKDLLIQNAGLVRA